MIHSHRFLVCVLDWGLGHASRSIPIIQALLDRAQTVLIAGSGDSLKLLQKEFPALASFSLPCYAPKYPKRGSMVLKMAMQLPKFIRTINAEHKLTERLCIEHKIDYIISDNRYGCWSSSTKCIFITHQSNILMPRRFGWLARVVRAVNERYINRFTECWIPDVPEENNITGVLNAFAHTQLPENIHFIGSLSRFKRNDESTLDIDVLVICSGPEPQRTIFEQILARQLMSLSLTYYLVRGVIRQEQPIRVGHQGVIIDYLTTTKLQDLISRARIVIARSGYSTVMDMMTMRKKVIFVPTPGQTEQEHLATVLHNKGKALRVEQKDFDLNKALRIAEKFSGFDDTHPGDYLAVEIDRLVKSR